MAGMDPNDPMAQFKATFFEECAELTADLEQRLTDLEDGDQDPETINAVFRAVHSIKAGGGAFQFTDLVNFTQKYEAVLDDLRSDRLELGADIIELLIRAADIQADLIAAAQTDEPVGEGYGQDVIDRFDELLGGDHSNAATKATQASASVSATVVQTTSSIPATGGDDEGANVFRIRFQPHADLFRHANEPLLLIRELKDLGELDVYVEHVQLPMLSTLDPESSYFHWEMVLRTEADKDAVAEVFEFVEDDCDLVILNEAVEHDKAEEGVDYGMFIDLTTGEQVADTSDPSAVPVESTAVIEAKTSLVPQPQVAKQAVPTPQAGPKSSHIKATSIRVDLDRVDKLVNMVGELVITQSMLAQHLSNSEFDRNQQIMNGFEELSMHTRELQENVMAIRMQPVKSVFARMRRLVRDLGPKLGKKVKLVTRGEDTEVDKTVIEELVDPLTHMIRNSLDHGLEQPDERAANGKGPEGTIVLSAEHRGGRIIIEIIDDGRGINRPKVLSKAKEKGIIDANATLTDEEIDNLIFAPGFSTADEVSDVSGRGVGMDVVRQNITSLGGRITVTSAPGKGTTTSLLLPLTLAVLDGMIVQVGDEHYVIPINNILESIRPTRQNVHKLMSGATVLKVRGNYIRLVSLARIFGVPDAVTDPCEGLVVLAETDTGQPIGLMVDSLLGQRQVVMKSLESNYSAIDGISAATILGNGKVCLIVDVEGLSECEKQHSGSMSIGDIESQIKQQTAVAE